MPGRERRLRRAAACAALLAAFAQAAAAVDVIRPRSLAFLQARGGIVVGEPRQERGEWSLPVDCDLSGLGSLHAPGNVLHAGLAWWRSAATIEGRRIFLTVETNVQGPDAPGTRCGPARLGPLAEGVYELIYRDPDGTLTPLGERRFAR